MYGAIIGDLAGSIYEYGQIKKVSSIKCNKLIEDNSFYSDDTILTIAILDAILKDKDYESSLKEYGKKYSDYKPSFNPYFNTSFSPGFTKWVNGNYNGKSTGNGALMRISPIGYLFNNKNDVIKNAALATIPSHNSNEAVNAATIVALIIFYSRCGYNKEEIIKMLNIKLVNRNLDKFNTTCKETLDICLYTLFNSNSFSDAISNTLLVGGDTDTNCCIVGSMAEAMYGIDKKYIDEADKHIPNEFKKILKKGYEKIGKVI